MQTDELLCKSCKSNFYLDSHRLPKGRVKSREWTDCITGKILKKVEIGKFFTTALKSIQKLVKLKSLVAKRCKM